MWCHDRNVLRSFRAVIEPLLRLGFWCYPELQFIKVVPLDNTALDEVGEAIRIVAMESVVN